RKETKKHKCLKTAKTSTKPGKSKKPEKSKKAVPSDKYETRLPIDGILTQLILYEENGVMKYRRPGSQPQAKGTKRKGRFPYESSSCSSRKRRSHAAFNEDNFPDGSYVWSDKDNCYHDVGGIPEDWSSESVGYNFDESDTD
ncbi:hypothetical protein OTU49_007787, partial [Cherax quadricarinatus]